MTDYERVLAGEVRPGDRVARARTHTFFCVDQVDVHAVTVTVGYVDSFHTDRPRKDARWWREVER